MYNGTTTSFWHLTDDHFDGAYMTVTQILDYYNLLSYPNASILKTKQYVRLNPMMMYHRKCSCLVQAFDEQINAYISGGLIEFWGRHFKPSRNERISIKPTPLVIHQIIGIVTACACLICLSIIVFFFELMSMRNSTIKSILDFFTFNSNSKNNL